MNLNTLHPYVIHSFFTKGCFIQINFPSFRDGFQLKNKPPAAGSQSMAPTKKPTVKDENSTVPTGKENSNTVQQKSSFLSKFRKESPRVPLKESAKGNTVIPVLLMIGLYNFGKET